MTNDTNININAEKINDSIIAGRDVNITQNIAPKKLPFVIGLNQPHTKLGEHFVGRQDLLETLHRSVTQTTGTSITALIGQGGIGKSTVASEYIWEHLGEFAGGVFWLDCDADFDMQYYTILKALDPSVDSFLRLREKKADIKSLVKSHLQLHEPGEKKLWIIDNFTEPESGNSWKNQKWLMRLPDISTLITSRMRICSPRVNNINVDKLSLDDSIRLLKTHMLTESNDALIAIAEKVDGLPLALSILAIILQDEAPQDVLTRLEQSEISEGLDSFLEELGEFGLEDEFAKNIAQTISISFEKLTTEEKSAAIVSAYFKNTPIPNEMLLGLHSVTPTSIKQLQYRHFLIDSGDNSAGHMHRIVSSYLRRTNQLDRDLLNSVGNMLLALLDGMENTENWHHIRTFMEHAVSFVEYLTRQASHLLFEREEEQTITIDFIGSRANGNQHYETAYMNVNAIFRGFMSLCEACRNMGDYDVVIHFETWLLESAKNYEGLTEDVYYQILNNLACSYNAAFQHQKAYDLLSKELTDIENKSYPLILLHTHADSLQMLNRQEESLKLRGIVYRERNNQLGPSHSLTLRSRNNYALSLLETESYKDALLHFIQVYAGQVNNGGINSFDAIITLSNIGLCYYKLKSHHNARLALEQSFIQKLRFFGKKHSSTQYTFRILWQVLFVQRRPDLIVQLHRIYHHAN